METLDGIPVTTPRRKCAQWTSKEKEFVAKKAQEGLTNQQIQAYLPHRTIDAIASQIQRDKDPDQIKRKRVKTTPATEKMLDILSRASHHPRVQEEAATITTEAPTNNEGEDEAPILPPTNQPAKVNAPPSATPAPAPVLPAPAPVLPPAPDQGSSSRAHTFYEVSRPEIKAHYLIFPYNPDLHKVEVVHSGEREIQVILDFCFDPATVTVLAGSVGQVYDWMRHHLQAKITTHTFQTPFPIGDIFPSPTLTSVSSS